MLQQIQTNTCLSVLHDRKSIVIEYYRYGWKGTQKTHGNKYEKKKLKKLFVASDGSVKTQNWLYQLYIPSIHYIPQHKR